MAAREDTNYITPAGLARLQAELRRDRSSFAERALDGGRLFLDDAEQDAR